MIVPETLIKQQDIGSKEKQTGRENFYGHSIILLAENTSMHIHFKII